MTIRTPSVCEVRARRGLDHGRVPRTIRTSAGTHQAWQRRSTPISRAHSGRTCRRTWRRTHRSFAGRTWRPPDSDRTDPSNADTGSRFRRCKGKGLDVCRRRSSSGTHRACTSGSVCTARRGPICGTRYVCPHRVCYRTVRTRAGIRRTPRGARCTALRVPTAGSSR